jgi:hypothetical protein
MFGNLKSKFLLVSLFFIIAGFFPMVSHADGCSQLEASLKLGTGDNLANGLPRICSATAALTLGTNLLLGFAGGVAVLFIVVGGFWYMTSAGNAEQAEKGMKTLQNAVIGLIVVVLSAVIVRIVLTTLTSTVGPGTTTPSTQTPGGAPAASTDPKTVFAGSIRIPDSVLMNGSLTVSAIFDSNVKDQLRQLAGGGDPSYCAFTVIFAGQSAGGRIVADANGKYIASATVMGPFAASAASPVSVSVCSTEVATQQIRIVGP